MMVSKIFRAHCVTLSFAHITIVTTIIVTMIDNYDFGFNKCILELDLASRKKHNFSNSVNKIKHS